MSMLEMLQKVAIDKREREAKLGITPSHRPQARIIPIRQPKPDPEAIAVAVPTLDEQKATRIAELEQELRRPEYLAQSITSQHRQTVLTTMRAVAKYYGLKVADLTSEQRIAEIVRPRQVAMYLSVKLTGRGMPFIGRQFGGRDHTTVLHGKRKIESLIKIDDTLAADIERLIAVLSPAESTHDRVTAQTPAEQRTGD